MSSLASRSGVSRIPLEQYLAEKFKYVERTAEDMHVYQQTALDFLLKNPFAALFIDTGLGKTIIILTLLEKLFLREQFKRALIVAPIRVAAQGWPNEIAAWSHTAFFPYTVIRAEDDDPEVIAAGKAAYAAEKADEWGAFPQKAAAKARTAKKEELRLERMRSQAPIHMIDHHHLEWLIDQYSEWVEVKSKGKAKKVRKIVGWPYDIVVLDESTAYGDIQAQKFKALVQVRLQGFIDRMILLTATPAADSYMKLFTQIFLLDKGKRLGRFITHYRNTYFDYNKHTFTYKLKKGADELISNKIADICLVMKSKDFLEEQEPLFLERKIDLTTPQLEQYQHFEENFVLHLPDEIIEAKNAAALSGKLLQFASGAVYTDPFADPEDELDDSKPTPKWRLVHDHKIEDLKELREEVDTPILVAYWYKSSLERLRKAFPDAAVMDKAGKVAARHGPWNTGKIKMLLVHPASVGHGLNMQYGPGRDVYMFDQCWSYELFYQLYRRLHRQGQKLQVRIHLPIVRETVDMLVWMRLKRKEDAQEALFNWIKKLRKRMKEAQAMRMAA